MASAREKRIAEFVDQFRVEPGSKVDARQGLRPGVQEGHRLEEGGRGSCSRAGSSCSPSTRRGSTPQGHARRARRPAGARRRRQGRDDPPRDERRQPAGRRGAQLQGALVGGARPRLPLALRAEAAGAAARSASSTARTTRRCSSSASTRSCSSGRSCRRSRAAHGIWKRRYREINDWERYLTDNGIRVVKLFLNLSKEEQRVRFLRRIDLPDHNWKFSSADVQERELLGRLPAGVLRDALAHEHRVGAVARDPGRPQVVRAHRRRRGDREHADRDRPALSRR